MRESALVRSIFRIVDRAAAGRTVSTVYLNVGVLRQTVPDALDFAWGCTSRQPENLAKSKLQVDLVSAAITCEECGADTPTDDNLIFTYATCNSTRYHVETGGEPVLTEMDVS